MRRCPLFPTRCGGGAKLPPNAQGAQPTRRVLLAVQLNQKPKKMHVRILWLRLPLQNLPTRSRRPSFCGWFARPRWRWEVFRPSAQLTDLDLRTPLALCRVANGDLRLPGVSTTLEKWVHDPFILGNDPMLKGSWRLQVVLFTLGRSLLSCKHSPGRQVEEPTGVSQWGSVRGCIRSLPNPLRQSTMLGKGVLPFGLFAG